MQNYEVFLNAEFRAGIAAALGLSDSSIQVSESGRVVAEYKYFIRNGKPFRPNYLYDAVYVESKAIGSNASRNAYWLKLSAVLVGKLHEARIQTINLVPSFSDVRPFTWCRFWASPFYSVYLTKDSVPESSARKEIKKALRAGYTVERATQVDVGGLFDCLVSTETRQNLPGAYSKTFTADALGRLLRLCPSLVFYICKKDGAVAGFRLVIHDGSNTAHDWLAAVDAQHLPNGISDLLLHHAATDLFRSGCEFFDLHGANVPNVQFFKFKHGGILIQSFRVSTLGHIFRSLLWNSLYGVYVRIASFYRRKSIPKDAP